MSTIWIVKNEFQCHEYYLDCAKIKNQSHEFYLECAFFSNQSRVYYLEHLFYSALKSKCNDIFLCFYSLSIQMQQFRLTYIDNFFHRNVFIFTLNSLLWNRGMDFESDLQCNLFSCTLIAKFRLALYTYCCTFCAFSI